MRWLTVRTSVACALLLLAAALAPAQADPPQSSTSGDRTFHITLTPPATPLDQWHVIATQAEPVGRASGPEIVNAGPDGTVARVASWTPALNQLALDLSFTNVGGDAAAATLVTDMVSPAWDPTLNPSGGEVLGRGDIESNGYKFGEHFPIGAIASGATVAAPVTLTVGTPGTLPAARYDLYYHVETGGGAGPVVRHGLPPEAPLARNGGKLVAPPSGGRYLALDTIDPSAPTDRWADRFEAKFNLHPAVYQFLGANHALDVETVEGYAGDIDVAAARGMMPALNLNVGTLGDTGNWTYQEIVDGAHDDFITAVATMIRDRGVPVLGFLGEEFNKSGDRAASSCGADSKSTCSNDKVYNPADATAYGDPAYPDNAERFRDASRHIVDLFDEVGATNVTYIVMANNATYSVPGFPYDEEGTDDAWWGRAAWFYPGPDYQDIGATQAYNSYPNPNGTVFDYPPLADQWRRHHYGYDDWTALDPTAMWAMPDDIQTHGTFPATGRDRSDLIKTWYATMDQFPQALYFGLYDNGADADVCAKLNGYCIDIPAVWTTTGIGDYGFFFPQEIDTFRAGEAGAKFVEQPFLSADGTPPARISDLTAQAAPGTVALQWTAPGSDGLAGQADHYVFRCLPDGAGALTAATWSSYAATTATAAVSPPHPAPGGSAESWTVTGLAPGSYRCGLKAVDAVHHSAPVSNVVTFTVG